MSHAPLAPSSAARTERCPGSALLAAAYPQEDTADTLTGDAVHWAGAELLRGDDICVGQVAPNNITLDVEMVEAAEMWAGFIKARGPVGDVEKLIANDFLHPLNWGTPDHSGFGALTLYVDDQKYGQGYIDVFGNWQLINYAGLRIGELLKTYGAKVWEIDVVMTICQPRCYHRDGPIRSWKVKARDLIPYFDHLRKQFAIAMAPNPPCIVSYECKNCPARHDCEANLAGAADAKRMAYQSVPLGITPDAAASELESLELAQAVLDSRVSGLRQQIESTIKRGQRVVGYTLDTGSGKTIWNKPQQEVIMLGEILGAPFARPDTVTPLQAIAICKRLKIDPAIIAQYSETTQGSAKLVRTADSAAAKAFSNQSK